MAVVAEKPQRPLFEIKNQTEDRVIYQRLIKAKGRSNKKIVKEVSKLPTATIHTFTLEEFQRLKEIERKLEFTIKKIEKNKRSFFHHWFFTFLEI